MSRLHFVALISVVTCAALGCEGPKQPPSSSSPSLPPVAGNPPKPPPVTITTGTSFRRGNEECRLLGLKDSSDPIKQQKATAFAKDWLKSIGGDTEIENVDPELRDGESVRVVWLISSTGNPRSCLNTDLARSGLVDIDETTWKGYKFYLHGKAGPEEMHWLGVLLMEADSGRRLGEHENRKQK